MTAVLKGRLGERENRLLADDSLPLHRLQSPGEAVDLPVSLSQLDLLLPHVLQSNVIPPPVDWRQRNTYMQ